MHFKQADWIHQTDVYEVNVRQYTPEGSFTAFGKHLPRLKAMGVSTLWFMPITPIATKEMKGTMGSPYACSDYTAINTEFGTLHDFVALVKEAHEMGFKVIIDWVANHTGWNHVWTQTHPDYYKIDPNTGTFRMASGMEDIIELDYSNPAMKNAMIEAMLYWVKTADIDGFRCDLASWVNLGFWLEARGTLEKTKTLFWLAECDPIDHPDYCLAFDACYSWNWMHQSESFYREKRDARELDHLLRKYDAVPFKKSVPLWFTTNHDENSWNGTEFEKYGDAVKAFAVFSFTWNGLPLLYSGQELPNHKRLQFFDKDVINWNGEYAMEGFYSTLLRLKRNNPALRAADEEVTTYFIETNMPASVLAYLRRNGKDEVMVLLNFSNHPVDVTLIKSFTGAKFNNVFWGGQSHVGDQSSFHLDAWGFQVLEKIIV